jgi:hypothetical protein
MKLFTLIWLVAFVAIPSLGAADTNTLSRTDYSSFKLITERNIFNSKRSSRSAQSRQRSEPQRQVKIESFSLVGTLTDSDRRIAFFDGASSSFRKALKPADSIAGFTVKAVEASGVTLERDGNETVLSVGMALRRKDDEPWEVVQPSISIPGSSSGASNAETSSNSGGAEEESEILKRMMQKRQEELK